jgi:hypothetical protein
MLERSTTETQAGSASPDLRFLSMLMVMEERQAARDSELRRERKDRETAREERERQVRMEMGQQQSHRDAQSQQLMILLVTK